MIVQCGSCRASFDVDDVILRPAGRKLKCSQCQAVFFQPPPKGGEKSLADKPEAPQVAPPPPATEAIKDPTSPQADQEVLKKISLEEENLFDNLDEEELPEPEPYLADDEPNEGPELLNEISVNDLFGDSGIEIDEFNDGLSEFEGVPANEAMDNYSDSFSNEVEELLAKDGLIDTYMKDEIGDEPQEFANLEPSFDDPTDVIDPLEMMSVDEEAETMLGPMPELALAKPTLQELKMAQLKQEQEEQKKQEKQEKQKQEKLKPQPVEPDFIEEKESSFAKMEEPWDTDEPSLDEEELAEDDEDLDDSPPQSMSAGAKKLWMIAAALLLTSGLGLASQTDWWSYKQFDLSSSVRLSAPHDEWRRYPFGMVLSVAGSVINTGRVVQMVPGLQVVLLDSMGKEVGKSLAYPGRVIDSKILDESSETALQAMGSLQSEDKKLKMNKLSPGQELSYQVLFVHPAKEATGFRLQLLAPSSKEQTNAIQSLPAKKG